MRRAGLEVVERHEPVWEGRRDAWRAGPRTALRLALAELRLARRVEGDYDAAVTGYPGPLDFLAARRALRDTPLVLNPLVSLADTFVADRARFRPGSPAARVLTAIDRRAVRAADVVVADTRAHAALFNSLGARTVEVCFVGAEERIFHPPWSPAEPPSVLFVGKLIPLHGLETILAAARLVPAVRFRVVGSGQQVRQLKARPSNVDWVPWIEYETLGEEYRRATVALGVFGTSAKAARVIPNKAFQALACGTPLVTADTPAARELLVNGVSALLVPPGDDKTLAAALSALLSDDALRSRVSAGGLAAYRELASEAVLARRWRDVIEHVAR